jgi:hypothetical protein
MMMRGAMLAGSIWLLAWKLAVMVYICDGLAGTVSGVRLVMVRLQPVRTSATRAVVRADNILLA